MGRTALRYAFAALVIVAAAGGAVPRLHAQSADALATGIAAIPPAVEDVRLFGAWEREGRSGVYRVVIARTGSGERQARLFVQWIATPEDGEASVMATTEITEVGGLKTDVVDLTGGVEDDGLALYVETGAGDVTSYEVYVTAPGEYTFGPLSN